MWEVLLRPVRASALEPFIFPLEFHLQQQTLSFSAYSLCGFSLFRAESGHSLIILHQPQSLKVVPAFSTCTICFISVQRANTPSARNCCRRWRKASPGKAALASRTQPPPRVLASPAPAFCPWGLELCLHQETEKSPHLIKAQRAPGGVVSSADRGEDQIPLSAQGHEQVAERPRGAGSWIWAGAETSTLPFLDFLLCLSSDPS